MGRRRKQGTAELHTLSTAAERVRSWRHAWAERARNGLAHTEGALRRLWPGRRAAGGALQILMLDDLVPDPLLGAGYPRADAIVRSLVAAGHRVGFYPMEAGRDDIARMTRGFGGTVRFWQGRGQVGLRRVLVARGDAFDLLFVSRPTPMRALAETGWRPARGLGPAVIYDAEAVLAPREARRRALFGSAWSHADYQAALRDELDLARGARAVTAVSRRDADTIGSVLDLPVTVLSHPVELRPGAAGFDQRQDLLFVGRLTGAACNSANVDSVRWFLTEVMPALDRLIGCGWRLHVAGLVDSPELEALWSDRVVRHGVVNDLDPLYARCRLFVAPTRYAAGIPLKVVEAMGRGIPCVATPLLAEQLGTDGAALPTGGTAEAFAAQCRRLCTDAVAWQAVRDAGLAHVATTCSPAAFDAALADALSQVDRGRRLF